MFFAMEMRWLQEVSRPCATESEISTSQRRCQRWRITSESLNLEGRSTGVKEETFVNRRIRGRCETLLSAAQGTWRGLIIRLVG